VRLRGGERPRRPLVSERSDMYCFALRSGYTSSSSEAVSADARLSVDKASGRLRPALSLELSVVVVSSADEISPTATRPFGTSVPADDPVRRVRVEGVGVERLVTGVRAVIVNQVSPKCSTGPAGPGYG
jgi:hypothetical protein